MKKQIIVIAGPTASGKTSLSVELAKKINGQIVGCDSMQIYKDMQIGTAKPTIEEMQDIKHYLVDIIEPTENFSVAKYQKMAFDCIEKIISNGYNPIVVGGTGQYMDSIIYETKFLDIEVDKNYRSYLEDLCKKEGISHLYNFACQIDNQACLKISPNDKKRIFRILEIYHQTGMTKTQVEKLSIPDEKKYVYKVFILDWPRDILYDRINKRVDLMLDAGLVDEVKSFYEKYKDKKTASYAIGYKEVKEYLDGILSYDQMVDKVKQASRNYAKRQLTWFRKDKNNIFLDATKSTKENIEFILKGINN